jgi:hypothetical protein
MSTLSSNDLVFYSDGNEIMSGGYSLNSLFLRNGISPMQTSNKSKGKGLESTIDEETNSKVKDNKVSSLFDDLAIPVGLFLNNNKLFSKNKVPYAEYEEHTTLSDDIFDKLFKMVEYESKKFSKTKKHKSGVKKGQTKKSRSSKI